jgi:hypothetical protein
MLRDGVISFGIGYVGKVDRVEGTGYRVTRAVQVINLPIVPLGGYVVREGSEVESLVAGLRSFHGWPAPLSWRSYAWALARSALFFGGCLAAIGVLPLLLGVDARAVTFASVPVGVATLAAWWGTRRGLVASPARARDIVAITRAGEAGRFESSAGAI